MYENISWIVTGVFLIALVIITQFIAMFSEGIRLVLFFVTALLSIFVIMRAASFAIYAISDYARKTGISDYLIGFLVVSIGTSLPELSTAVFASMAHAGQLVLGDVVGANIIDVTVVLGLTAIIGRKIAISGKVIGKTVLTVLVMALLPILLGVDGDLSRLDGILLIIGFTAYILSLLRKEGKFGKVKKSVAWKDIWRDMIIFLGSLVALLLSARWLVRSSVGIADIIEIPIYIVGLIFVALGTTIPELTVEIKSVLRGLSGIAFGDILGSVVVNSSLVLGVAALLSPFSFDRTIFITSALFMVATVSLAIIFMRRKKITWKHGLVLLVLYLAFLVTEISML
ncbi:hypothetical protein KY339_00760 [Candidatus Woesearchaeota archaeon]|nr:hypothetical protein [Candidatus Woesearchaeota archaeon]